MPSISKYVCDTLMRELVGRDRRPASFLVYIWLLAEEQRRQGIVSISYAELAEKIGIAKSTAQSAIGWLRRRKLVATTKASATATPAYRTQAPWNSIPARGRTP
jgi:hypothetical protein